MNKKYDLVCDQCGGMMQYNENRTEMHCEYCGNIVIIPDKEQQEKIAYAKRKAELDAQHRYYEKEKRKERRHLNVSKLIALLIVFGIVSIPFIIAAAGYIFRPTINPFDYIEVSFSGVDGEGVAEVELTKSDRKIGNLEDLCITVSKSYNLSENEIITITTSDWESPCWHSKNIQEYTVTGLELFLSDLNDIDEDAEKLIHQKSEQLIGMAIDNKPQITNLEFEKFYLLSDDDKNNLLYDVYSATWELVEGEDKTIYLVAYYTDIIVHGGENATFSYDECMYTGDILSEGSFQNGAVTAFESLGDIELDLNTNRSPDMNLTEK